MCAEKKQRRARRRTIPQPNQISMRGACTFFDSGHSEALAEIVGRPLQITSTALAGHLNFITESFLVRYAHDRFPTPHSKTAAWCLALARDVDGLLAALGNPDAGYPDREMNLQTSIVLTNVGEGLSLHPHQYQIMQLGDDAWAVLDRVPAALWCLKKAAEYAGKEYAKQAAQDGSKLNARQPQNVYLLGAMARAYESAWGETPPPSRPNPEGPFVKAVDFVRLRIIEGIESGESFTVHGTDVQAVKRLRQFTPSAAASLWTRQGKAILANLWLPRFDSMMER